MRTTALSALVLLGASLVASSPIRVVVTAHQEVSTHGPYLATIPPPPSSDGLAAIRFSHIDQIGGNGQDGMKHGNGRHLCQSMFDKAFDAMNNFRAMLGLPLVAPEHPSVLQDKHGNNIVHILPIEFSSVDLRPDVAQLKPILPFVGTPVRPGFGEPSRQDWLQRPDDSRRMHRFRHHQQSSFLRRVHHALMSLGPWEGRAVAFVLGCGIGVLLRMMWVIVLLTARAIRGPSHENSQTDGYIVVCDDDAEFLVPPPQYTVLSGSEAVPVPTDEKAEEE
ncbi:hypothetical protein BC628DRAFT_1331296 [Trametes gibbosa]|nr:hypothetical protein BC628DRAFT_1331296 [Trametes gibbosa]